MCHAWHMTQSGWFYTRAKSRRVSTLLNTRLRHDRGFQSISVESSANLTLTDLLADTPSVLVTDDTGGIRNLVARVLAADGYMVETATDGPQALEKIGRRLFDLYLLDVAMPMMDGQELAAVLRTYHPSARVLYITAYSDRLFQDKRLLSDREAFLEKPFTPQGLRQAVSHALFGHLQGPPVRPDVDAGSRPMTRHR
jgi:CheY-like chemotaxis protein